MERKLKQTHSHRCNSPEKMMKALQVSSPAPKPANKKDHDFLSIFHSSLDGRKQAGCRETKSEGLKEDKTHWGQNSQSQSSAVGFKSKKMKSWDTRTPWDMKSFKGRHCSLKGPSSEMATLSFKPSSKVSREVSVAKAMMKKDLHGKVTHAALGPSALQGTCGTQVGNFTHTKHNFPKDSMSRLPPFSSPRDDTNSAIPQNTRLSVT